jgi:pyrroloquinoline quinone biosynthesis protein D
MNASSRPRLARKARLRRDPIDGRLVLLAPERGLVLNDSAASIVELCDGRQVVEIARMLDAPLADVIELCAALAARGLVRG